MRTLLILLLMAGCADAGAKGPRMVVKTAGDIDYGVDTCAWSGKVIETVRYGAVLETSDGSRLTFNSAENMARHLESPDITPTDIRGAWVVDFAAGNILIPVDDAVYLHSPNRPSPGGLRITPVAKADAKMREYVRRAYPGTYLEWSAVRDLVRRAP